MRSSEVVGIWCGLAWLKCLLLARSCRFRTSALRSLTEGKQTCRGHAKIDANDSLRSYAGSKCCSLSISCPPDVLLWRLP
jgi:hypothetical protein